MNCLRLVLLATFLFAFASIGCNRSPSDQSLTTGIQAKLYADPITKPASVNVAVKGGVVTLSGDVPSSDVALEAMKIANGTPGVKSVNDQLTVNGSPAANATSPVSPAPSAGNAPPSASTPQPRGTASYPPLPSSTAPSTSPPTQEAAQPLAGSPPSARAPQPSPAEEARITIPAGEDVTVRMIDPIDSAHNTAGQVFHATLAAPITAHGRVVIPKGAPALILLANSTSAGRVQGRSELEVRLSRIDYHWHNYRVTSSIYEQEGKARGQQTAVRTGVGAAAGAIIGAIAGGGKGAAIGSAAGGGAGFGVNALTHGPKVKIPSESLLTFRLQRPLIVQP